ncbi:MAG: ABC transporter ATP-binding protein [Bulleidia sp.]|nr:ABC transporter ATP-binding protein [Bulleidia sp.]
MKEKKKSSFQWILEFAGEKKSYYVISVILSVLSVLCGLVPYYIVGHIIEGIMTGVRESGYYIRDIGIMAVFWCLHAVLFSLSTYNSHKGTFAVLASLRRKVLAKLASVSLGQVKDRDSGEYKSIIVDRVDGIESSLAHVIPEVFGNLFGAVVMMVCMIAVDWRMGLLSLLVLPPGMLFMSLMMVGNEKWTAEAMKRGNELNRTAVEYINGIEVIKVYGQTRKSYSRFTEAAKNAAGIYIDMMRHYNFDQNMTFALMPAGLIILIPAGVVFMMHGTMDLTTFIMSCVLCIGEMQPMINAFSYLDDIQMADSVISDVTRILELPDMQRPEKMTQEPCGSEIVFRNVSFRYGETEVLHDINLTIHENAVNALVGPSGSGKSTITKLIASFYEPGEGEILLGGVNLRDMPLEECARRISYVAQDNYLFGMSIMENIRLGRQGASDEEVIQAAKNCGIDAFIRSLPDGYQTIAGHGGSHLSGGERQRICIARAMLKNADIIILDEASSYADPENERLVQESLSHLLAGRTVIVVAHRLSTIADADQIILVNNGRIEASGSQDQLLKSSDLYRRMWQAHMAARDIA